jgi:hypothetical protein
LFKDRKEKGIPENLISLTILSMKNSCAMVKIKNVLSKQFETKEG